MLPGSCVLHCNRHIGARERRQLIPHVHFQVPFLGPESQWKSGFACAGLLCMTLAASLAPSNKSKMVLFFVQKCLCIKVFVHQRLCKSVSVWKACV